MSCQTERLYKYPQSSKHDTSLVKILLTLNQSVVGSVLCSFKGLIVIYYHPFCYHNVNVMLFLMCDNAKNKGEYARDMSMCNDEKRRLFYMVDDI